ncbi:MAG TPA: hypothetical protein VGF89_00970 [Steroidobacteraceae bacterium]
MLASIDPISQAAGTAATGWVPVLNHDALLALIDVGVFGASATVDSKIQQAQDGSGTGAKDLTGKAITQLLAAGGNNRQAAINFRSSDLDTNNGFGWVKLSVTVGTAASLIQALLLGFYPTFETGEQFNQAGVAQIV